MNPKSTNKNGRLYFYSYQNKKRGIIIGFYLSALRIYTSKFSMKF